MSTRIGSVVTFMSLASLAACSSDKAGVHSSASTAPLGSTWTDVGKMPDLFTGMWMSFSPMVESDEKLNVPYTEKAAAYVAQYKPKRDIPYAEEGCLTPGLPISMRAGPLKFSYEPGLISVYMQSVGNTRFIRLNREQGQTTPKYYGNSVGHWEGDTLVVETADFMDGISFQYGVGPGLPAEKKSAAPSVQAEGGPASPPQGGAFVDLSKAIWGPHGPNMRMVERMHLLDPETLEIQLTIYDDNVWTKPYQTQTRTWRRIRKGVSEIGPFNGEPEEWVCTVSITSFDPKTNTYVDKDPEEMVKYLDNLGH